MNYRTLYLLFSFVLVATLGHLSAMTSIKQQVKQAIQKKNLKALSSILIKPSREPLGKADLILVSNFLETFAQNSSKEKTLDDFIRLLCENNQFLASMLTDIALGAGTKVGDKLFEHMMNISSPKTEEQSHSFFSEGDDQASASEVHLPAPFMLVDQIVVPQVQDNQEVIVIDDQPVAQESFNEFVQPTESISEVSILDQLLYAIERNKTENVRAILEQHGKHLDVKTANKAFDYAWMNRKKKSVFLILKYVNLNYLENLAKFLNQRFAIEIVKDKYLSEKFYRNNYAKKNFYLSFRFTHTIFKTPHFFSKLSLDDKKILFIKMVKPLGSLPKNRFEKIRVMLEKEGFRKAIKGKWIIEIFQHFDACFNAYNPSFYIEEIKRIFAEFCRHDDLKKQLTSIAQKYGFTDFLKIIKGEDVQPQQISQGQYGYVSANFEQRQRAGTSSTAEFSMDQGMPINWTQYLQKPVEPIMQAIQNNDEKQVRSFLNNAVLNNTVGNFSGSFSEAYKLKRVSLILIFFEYFNQGVFVRSDLIQEALAVPAIFIEFFKREDLRNKFYSDQKSKKCLDNVLNVNSLLFEIVQDEHIRELFTKEQRNNIFKRLVFNCRKPDNIKTLKIFWGDLEFRNDLENASFEYVLALLNEKLSLRGWFSGIKNALKLFCSYPNIKEKILLLCSKKQYDYLAKIIESDFKIERPGARQKSKTSRPIKDDRFGLFAAIRDKDGPRVSGILFHYKDQFDSNFLQEVLEDICSRRSVNEDAINAFFEHEEIRKKLSGELFFKVFKLAMKKLRLSIIKTLISCPDVHERFFNRPEFRSSLQRSIASFFSMKHTGKKRLKMDVFFELVRHKNILTVFDEESVNQIVKNFAIVKKIQAMDKDILEKCFKDETFRGMIKDRTLEDMLDYFAQSRLEKYGRTTVSKVLNVFCVHDDLKKRLYALGNVERYNFVLAYLNNSNNIDVEKVFVYVRSQNEPIDVILKLSLIHI